MARRLNEQDQGSEKGKIRFIIAEVEGNNQTLQDLVRTFAPLLAKPVQIQLPSKRSVTPQDAGAAHKVAEESTLFSEDDPSVVDADSLPAQQPSESTNGTSRRKRGEGVTRDRNSGLSIVKSLNLRPDDKDSLKDFVAAKKPQSQMEHIAVYVYYMKQILEEPAVGLSHVFTCFDEVSERLPEDLPQTCRNIASKKGWIDTADQDDLKIATRGLNFVQKDLPRSSGSVETGKR
jgi:hypothetical protein